MLIIVETCRLSPKNLAVTFRWREHRWASCVKIFTWPFELLCHWLSVTSLTLPRLRKNILSSLITPRFKRKKLFLCLAKSLRILHLITYDQVSISWCRLRNPPWFLVGFWSQRDPVWTLNLFLAYPSWYPRLSSPLVITDEIPNPSGSLQPLQPNELQTKIFNEFARTIHKILLTRVDRFGHLHDIHFSNLVQDAVSIGWSDSWLAAKPHRY